MQILYWYAILLLQMPCVVCISSFCTQSTHVQRASHSKKHSHVCFHVQEIELGYATGVLAVRTSCVGELGWELHIPTEVRGCYRWILVEYSMPHFDTSSDICGYWSSITSSNTVGRNSEILYTVHNLC